MSRRINSRHRGVTALFLLITAGLVALTELASALPEDKQQPIRISADHALRDEKKGLTVYRGNVKLDQGSLHIEAHRLTIYHPSKVAEKIVAQGTPATFRQQPTADKSPVKARARVIEYYRNEERIHLQTEAQIEQDGATVAGDTIDYLLEEELVKAGPGQAGSGNRVQVVIPANPVGAE